MNFSETFTIDSDYKDIKKGCNWSLPHFSEIIILDKKENTLYPLVYQLQPNVLLHENDNLRWNSVYQRLSSNALIFLGQATNIEKNQKRVFLSQWHMLRYSYLIVISSSKGESVSLEKFIIGIQALINALRVKKYTSFSLYSSISSFFHKNSKRHLFEDDNYSILSKCRSVAKLCIESNLLIPLCSSNSFNKGLYEVHV